MADNKEQKKPSPEETKDKLAPDALSSPSKEEADKMKEQTFSREFTNEEGNKVRESALTEDDMKRHREVESKIPPAFNETQRLTGSVGQVNLTQSGTLNSDKSVRAKRSIEDINAELEAAAGPNPTPNRDGNEMTKIMNGIRIESLANIDQDTSAMADEIHNLLEKDEWDDNDISALRGIEEKLRATARV